MTKYDRRSVLAGLGGLGTALVAGCSGGGGGSDGGDGDGDGDGNDVGADTTTRSVLSRVDRTTTVAAGEFKKFSMNPNTGGTYEMEFTVTAGPAVDVLFMRVQQISYFENGVNFEYIEDASVTNATEGSASTDLTSGQYFLAVDNSDRSEAQPTDAEAEVEVTATITP